MKCPACGNTDEQQRIGPPDEQAGPTGYRCDKCGRLYPAPVETMQHDFDDILDRLEQLRVKAEEMAREQARFVQQIDEARAQVEAVAQSPPPGS